MLSAREITDRRAAEEAQTRLTAILDSTIDFVGTTDPHGRFLYLNRGAREVLGIPEDEDIEWLRDILRKHLAETGSAVATRILDRWHTEVRRFVKVMPKDYKRVLAEMAASTQDDLVKAGS